MILESFSQTKLLKNVLLKILKEDLQCKIKQMYVICMRKATKGKFCKTCQLNPPKGGHQTDLMLISNQTEYRGDTANGFL